MDLNKCIKRPYHPIPSFDDVAVRCAGAERFFKTDARNGYWSMVLDEESADLTTFSTTFGRYRFKRYPFGLISAQDEYQKRMEEAFEGIDIGLIVDDVAGMAESTTDHDRKLRTVMQRAREKGIKFNKEKCLFDAVAIPYFGHILTKGGMEPDPNKIRAMKEMPAPKNKDELQTLLGMYNYLSRYIPGLSTLNQPLRDLAKAKEFKWKVVHNDARVKIQEAICSNLAYFDTKSAQVEVITDASQHGLGAQLVADHATVAFASRSLSDTEKRYSQIEKELLGIVFACTHFHQYICGRKITVTTDHKPLEAILSKPINRAPPRLQRMMLVLQQYELSFQYRPGKEIPVADALSRMHLPDQDPEIQIEGEVAIHAFFRDIPVSRNKLEQVREETLRDVELKTLSDIVESGWPNDRRDVPSIVLPFWNYRDELVINDGIILKGERIVVPKALRGDILRQLHSSHVGIVKTKERARSSVFWPNITKDITQLVSGCEICAMHQMDQQKEPLISSEVPQYPFQHVGLDIFTFSGMEYLITVDYYSRFFEVDKLAISNSQQVISKLKMHFARYGIPEKITSDNGPQFSSEQFRTFAASWDINHVTSSPRYPQSNGMSEKAVQTAKRIMTKATESRTDPYIALLEYRNTPVDGAYTPVQLLMSRKTRSMVPALPSHLQPKIIAKPVFEKAREKAQARQQRAHNKNAKELKELSIGEKVWVKFDENSRWRKGVVEKKLRQQERSYLVRLQDNSTLRRNRRHLRHRSEPVIAEPAPIPSHPLHAGRVTQCPELHTYPDGTATVGASTTPVADRSSAELNSSTDEETPSIVKDDDFTVAERPNVRGEEERALSLRCQSTTDTVIPPVTSTEAPPDAGRVTCSGRLSKPPARMNLSIDRHVDIHLRPVWQ